MKTALKIFNSVVVAAAIIIGICKGLTIVPIVGFVLMAAILMDC